MRLAGRAHTAPACKGGKRRALTVSRALERLGNLRIVDHSSFDAVAAPLDLQDGASGGEVWVEVLAAEAQAAPGAEATVAKTACARRWRGWRYVPSYAAALTLACSLGIL